MTTEHTSEMVESAQIESMLDAFHDHIDRALMAATVGRWERVGAYLAAAGRLLAVLPEEIIAEFELSGHLTGVTRGLLHTATPQPLIA